MINLIKNEIIKIFKKKAIYITLAITLIFIIGANALCKYGDLFSFNTYSNNYKIYLETELQNLDYKKVSDNAQYIMIKTDLDVVNLQEKYEEDSWQYQIVNEKMYQTIKTYNECKYALEPNEESLEVAEKEYNRYLELLESDDWKYFAKEDLEQVKAQIAKLEEDKGKAIDLVEQDMLEGELYEQNLQKQILEWRLEKDISYTDERSYLLNRYKSNQLDIQAYENNNEDKTYSDKLQYQDELKEANISRYAIEHDIKMSMGNDFKGLLEDFFSNFELFIIVIIVMIAGSIVSEEFNKGTIKLLLVKPYSRTKILLSKYITVLLTIIFTTITVIAMQTIVGGLFFGFDDLKVPTLAYNFITNSVMEMNIFSYLGIVLLHKLPQYILIATIAFSFSTATNTPVAIVISLLGYMSTTIINAFVREFNIVFMKFFITPNWDLTKYLFGQLPEFEFVNFNFSIAICVIYLILMIIPTFIVFKRRNIKNV